MTGTVDDCNIDDARTRQLSDQTSLYEYHEDTDETYVGIVHSANSEMVEVCDTIDDRLAPSQQLFSEWIEERDEFRREMSYKEAHNRAFDSVNYRMRYIDETDVDVLDEYAQRVLDGENIVLVCYCSNGCMCHRKIAKEYIHNRMRING